MRTTDLIQSLIVLVVLFLLQCSATRNLGLSLSKNKAYLRKTCSATAYPKLCYRSLARHSSKINSDPKALALMALNTTLYSVRMTSKLLREMSKKQGLRPNEAAAMLDCVEDIGDCVRTLAEYNTGESEHMRTQMNDAQMWVNSVMDDDETCMEALDVEGKVRRGLRRRIVRLARLTSNALTLVKGAYASV